MNNASGKTYKVNTPAGNRTWINGFGGRCVIRYTTGAQAEPVLGRIELLLKQEIS